MQPEGLAPLFSSPVYFCESFIRRLLHLQGAEGDDYPPKKGLF
jgi:hypothetical protein